MTLRERIKSSKPDWAEVVLAFLAGGIYGMLVVFLFYLAFYD